MGGIYPEVAHKNSHNSHICPGISDENVYLSSKIQRHTFPRSGGLSWDLDCGRVLQRALADMQVFR